MEYPLLSFGINLKDDRMDILKQFFNKDNPDHKITAHFTP